jgi:hypothetical protein
MGISHLVCIPAIVRHSPIDRTHFRSLIHLLLLGTIFYQITPEGKQVIVDEISWRFSLLCTLNAIYVNLWASDHYVIGTWTHAVFMAYLHYQLT